MKQLLVLSHKNFKITVPDDAKITFGPWSPPVKGARDYERSGSVGTLRIYQGTKENIIGCFSGVTGFRDLSMQFAEEVVREEGATIWKDDEKGYVRENKVAVVRQWSDAQLTTGDDTGDFQPAKKRGKK